VFRRFWRELRILEHKVEVIRDFEIGFSTRMRSAGARIVAWAPDRETNALVEALGTDYLHRTPLARGPVNQSLLTWPQLLAHFGFPFLKTDALEVNRYGFREAGCWYEFLPAEAADWRDVVENHLRMVCPDAKILRGSKDRSPSFETG
jgi:hypothetical protein